MRVLRRYAKMNYLSVTIALLITVTTHSSCSHNTNGSDLTASIIHDNYTEQEVINLKKILQSTNFPQRDGFVQSLLKKDSYLKMRSVSFVLPDKEGIIHLDPLIVQLNDDSTLVVHKALYTRGNSPFPTERVETNAKITTKQKGQTLHNKAQ